MDTFQTMLFKIKIIVMLDLQKKVFIGLFECSLFGKKTTLITDYA